LSKSLNSPMKTTRRKTLALLAAISFLLPNPAFALRQNQPETKENRAGLEEALAGMEERMSIDAGAERIWEWIQKREVNKVIVRTWKGQELTWTKGRNPPKKDQIQEMVEATAQVNRVFVRRQDRNRTAIVAYTRAALEGNLSAGMEEAPDAEARDLLLRFEREPDSQARILLLERELPKLQPAQRVGFLRGLPYLADQGRVSDLIGTVFTSDEGSALHVRDWLLQAIREGGPGGPIATMRNLISGLPMEKTNQIATKFLPLLFEGGQLKPEWREIGNVFSDAVMIGGAESLILRLRSKPQAWRNDPKWHMKMAQVHAKLAELFSRLEYPPYTRVEADYSVLHLAIVQYLTGRNFGGKRISEKKIRTIYQSIEPELRDSLQEPDLTDPILKFSDWEMLIELEEMFGDYLKLRSDPEHITHYQNAQRLRKEKTDWITRHRRALGLVQPAAGMEEAKPLDLDTVRSLLEYAQVPAGAKSGLWASPAPKQTQTKPVRMYITSEVRTALPPVIQEWVGTGLIELRDFDPAHPPEVVLGSVIVAGPGALPDLRERHVPVIQSRELTWLTTLRGQALWALAWNQAFQNQVILWSPPSATLVRYEGQDGFAFYV